MMTAFSAVPSPSRSAVALCSWFHPGSPITASLFLVWSIIVGALDNVLRPILIRKGADLPLLLIFAGVIGGLVAFGIVGLFIGPVVLGIAYTLLNEWISDAERR